MRYIERTGFEPTASEYAKIEDAYYDFNGNKAGNPENIFDDVIYSTCYSGFYAEYFQD